MADTLILATQNYRDFKPELMNGVPVRISRGYPRFPLKYEKVVEKVTQLYPGKDLHGKGLRHEEFRRRYRKQLDYTGVDEIRKMLEGVQKRHPGKRLVLLCFEKVLDGEICHRRYFAEWWYEQTGLLVPEIAVNVNTGRVIEYIDDLVVDDCDPTTGFVVEHHNRGGVGPLREESRLF